VPCILEWCTECNCIHLDKLLEEEAAADAAAAAADAADAAAEFLEN
jgi:hypothetical protein